MSDDHLHDEALTDAVDGAASPEALSHLAGCAACRSRLDAIRTVVAAVAVPPPSPSPARRDAAVARALSGAAPPRRRPVIAPWMAAAAVIALLLGGAGLILATRDDGNGDQTAATRPFGKAAESDTGAALRADGLIDAGDLGDQRDAVALNAVLKDRLGGGTNAGATGGAADSSSGAATDGSPAPAAAPASTATNCVAEAQDAGSGRVGTLVLVARLRWQGEPAVVLVFAGPDQAQLGRRAFVMARRDCRLLVAQSF